MNNQDTHAQNLELDYQATMDVIQLLTDLRFKLLAFIPTVSGFAVAFLGKNTDTGVELGLGVLGLVVTLGIVLYDQRNSQIYNACMHRAKWLEYLLDLPKLTHLDWRKETGDLPAGSGGVVSERPFMYRKLFQTDVLTAKHDRALSLIYGASLGGWAYLIIQSLLSLAFLWPGDRAVDSQVQMTITLVSLIFAALTTTLFTAQLNKLDDNKQPYNQIPPRPQQELEEIKYPTESVADQHPPALTAEMH